MKKIYIAPTIESITLHSTPLLTTSEITNGGEKNENFDAESKSWGGTFVWDDTSVDVE